MHNIPASGFRLPATGPSPDGLELKNQTEKVKTQNIKNTIKPNKKSFPNTKTRKYLPKQIIRRNLTRYRP